VGYIYAAAGMADMALDLSPMTPSDWKLKLKHSYATLRQYGSGPLQPRAAISTV